MHALPHDHTGARIKRLRLERHLTQTALSELSGVPYSTLTKAEQGVKPASGLEAAHRQLPDSFLSYGNWLGV